MSRKAQAERPGPDTRADYGHFMPITTRLMDNDLYSHLNNAAYYSFMDTAVTSYLVAAGNRVLALDPVVYFVVENGCTYFRQIAFPDLVHVGLRVTHVGTSSMRFETGLFRNDETLTAARGFFTQVCCERATQRPVTIPPAVRTALEALRR